MENIDYSALLDTIMQGNCTLFVGAGFSLDAVNFLDQKLRLADKLKEFLLTKIGETDFNTDLMTASREYLRKKGDHELIKVLKEEFTIKETSPAQDFILSLPWRRIYTTNYDDVVEVSSKKNGTPIECISLDKNPLDYKNKRGKCICLNGSIRQLNPDTLYKQFKLTNVSYLTTEFAESGWITLFRDDLAHSDLIFFIGFSMKGDLDIQRIVYNLSIKEKTQFIIWEKETQRSIAELADFGKIYPIGVSTFSQKLSEAYDEFIPLENLPMIYESFRRVNLIADIPVL